MRCRFYVIYVIGRDDNKKMKVVIMIILNVCGT